MRDHAPRRYGAPTRFSNCQRGFHSTHNDYNICITMLSAKRASLWALCSCSALETAHLLLLTRARRSSSPPWPPHRAAVTLHRIASVSLGPRLGPASRRWNRRRWSRSRWWNPPARNGLGACSRNTRSPQRRPRTRASGAWRRPGQFARTSCFPTCGADSETLGRTAAARKAVLACRRVTCKRREKGNE